MINWLNGNEMLTRKAQIEILEHEAENEKLPVERRRDAWDKAARLKALEKKVNHPVESKDS